tara:strand:- start:2130 stop:2849 length:720 start_codon:yes stop_codon:yes gene_type:complete
MKSLVNISIDDVSPHPHSSLKVVKNCFKVIEKFPNVVFTLFVPTGYWRTVPRPPISYNREPFLLSKNKNFCDFLRRLDSKNFEIAYHGHYHGIQNENNNDEFRDLNYDQANQKIKQMFYEVEQSNLQNIFKMYFRPPAWRLSPDSFKALRDNGFKLLALSAEERMKNIYKGEDEHTRDVVYYNVNPPYMPLKLNKKTEIVYHACEWDKNYFSEQKADELISFLEHNLDNIKFVEIGNLL